MQPRSYLFPSITVVQPDYSLIDVRNQYSILNRLKSRDVLGSFSYDMEWRLPKINQRVRYLEDKENQLTDMDNRLAIQSRYLQEFQNMLGCHCQCSGHQCSHQNPKPQPQLHPQEEVKKPQRQPSKKTLPSDSSQNDRKNQRRKRILRKFRKYAYAVYFTIYLKHFSSKFTKNRYNFFKNRYLVNDGDKVKQDSFKITKSLEAIRLLPLILQAPTDMNRIAKLRIESSKVINTKTTTKLIPQNSTQKFIKAMNFVNLYLKELQHIILSKKFVDYYAQIIGIGTLNQSFFMDELMIPQQIQFITFSEKKGFAQISSQTEQTLIMTYIFAKHILFKILLRLREKKYLQTNLIDDFGKYRGQMEKIYEFLQLANGILYALVNSVFLEFLDSNSDLQTNYENLKKKFKISPAKVLTAPNCPKEIRQTVNYRQLILGVPKVAQIESILQDFSYRQYVNYLMGHIQEVSQRLLNQVRYVNKVVYDHIKQETMGQKYLIFEGIKNEQTIVKVNNTKTMRSNRQMYMNQGGKLSNNLVNMANNMTKLNMSMLSSGMKQPGNVKSIRQYNNNNNNINNTKSQSNLNMTKSYFNNNITNNNNKNNDRNNLYSRLSNTSLGNDMMFQRSRS